MEILNVENLIFSYPKQKTPVLNDISFSVGEGEFVVLCGATGSGKSTLLKLIKPEITPLGEKRGHVTLLGEELSKDDEDKKISASRIGYVCQNPKEQVVTDKVWHELAFGLENMKMSQNEMNAKVAEMAAYFGIEDWFDKRTDELSGGQLQLLNLASVMVMDPDILILDEPSAQLDPVAASEFFTTIKKLNSDFALTIIIAEHRLEELIPICDRVLVMKNGRISLDGKPDEILNHISQDEEIFEALPSAYRLYKKINDKTVVKENNQKNTDKVPINIREGREYLKQLLDKTRLFENELSKKTEHSGKSINDNVINIDNINKNNILEKGKIVYTNNKNSINIDNSLGSESKLETPKVGNENTALEFKDVNFRYTRESSDALKDLSFKVNTGEIFCILGGNGSGKTTALNAAAGLIKPYEGYIKLFSKKLKEYKNQSLYDHCLSMLPQDVQTIFLHNTVREELESRKALEKLRNFPFDLSNLLDKHPYDLSGGEQQLLTLAIVLATEPKIVLLDEPTKGLDAYRKKNLAGILKKLKAENKTIVLVTHDVEFAAECADRCALFFRGGLASIGDAQSFFHGNSFYTTSACRLSRGICEGAVTIEDLTDFIITKKIKQ